MTSGQKVALSLLISVLAFCAFTVVAFSGLFDLIEVNFYQPVVQEIKQKKIEEIAAAQNEYFDTLMQRFASFSSDAAVKTYVESRPGDSSVRARESLRAQLVTATQSLKGIRIVSVNGRNIFFSTFSSDVISSRGGIAYRDYNVSDEIAYESVRANPSVAESAAPDKKCRIIKDGDSNLLIFSLPFYDAASVLVATILFYCDATDFSHFLFSRNLIDINGFAALVTNPRDTLRKLDGFGGFVFGLPNYGASSIRNQILSRWRQSEDETFWRLEPVEKSGTETLSESRVLCAFSYRQSREDFGFITLLYDEADLKFPQYMRLLILTTALITFYLAVFLILSFKHDDIVVIRDKVRRYESEFFIGCKKMDGAKDPAYLAEQKPILERRILKSLGRKGERHLSEFKSIFESGWAEMLVSFGEPNSAAPSLMHGYAAPPINAEELKEIVRSSLEDILESGKVQIGVREVERADSRDDRRAVEKFEEVDAAEIFGETDVAAADDAGVVEEAERLDDAEVAETADDAEPLGDAESLEEAEVIEDVESLDDAEVAESAADAEPLGDMESLEEAESVEEAETLDDAEVAETADEAESLGDAESLEEAEAVEDVESLDEAGDAESAADAEPLGDMESLEGAESVEEAETLDDAEVAESADDAESLGDMESLEEAEVIEDVENLDDAEVAEVTEDAVSLGDVEALKEAEVVEEAEALDDAEVAETADDAEPLGDVESLEEAEAVDEAESLDDAEVAEVTEDAEPLGDVEALEEAEAVDEAESLDEAGAAESAADAEPLGDVEVLEEAEAVKEAEVLDDEELAEITDDTDVAEVTEDAESLGDAESLEEVEAIDEVETLDDAGAAESTDDVESLEEAEVIEDVESLDDTEIAETVADDVESLEEAEVIEGVENLDDAEVAETVADDAESLDEAEVIEGVESLDDAEVAEVTDDVEALGEAEVVEEAEALDDADIAESADDVEDIEPLEEEAGPLSENGELRLGAHDEGGGSRVADDFVAVETIESIAALDNADSADELEVLPEYGEKEERADDIARTLAALPEKSPDLTKSGDDELDSDGLSRKLSSSEMHDIVKLRDAIDSMNKMDLNLEELELVVSAKKSGAEESAANCDADTTDNEAEPNEDDVYKDEVLLEKIEFGVPTANNSNEPADDSIADNFVVSSPDYSFLDEDEVTENLYKVQPQGDVKDDAHFFENPLLLRENSDSLAVSGDAPQRDEPEIVDESAEESHALGRDEAPVTEDGESESTEETAETVEGEPEIIEDAETGKAEPAIEESIAAEEGIATEEPELLVNLRDNPFTLTRFATVDTKITELEEQQ